MHCDYVTPLRALTGHFFNRYADCDSESSTISDLVGFQVSLSNCQSPPALQEAAAEISGCVSIEAYLNVHMGRDVLGLPAPGRKWEIPKILALRAYPRTICEMGSAELTC